MRKYSRPAHVNIRSDLWIPWSHSAPSLPIGITYGQLPVGLRVFAEFRKPKELICPENGEAAHVTVDTTYAAMTSAVGIAAWTDVLGGPNAVRATEVA